MTELEAQAMMLLGRWKCHRCGELAKLYFHDTAVLRYYVNHCVHKFHCPACGCYAKYTLVMEGTGDQ